MANALKLRADIKKIKKALQAKGVSDKIKDKLKGQLEKAEGELSALKAPKKKAKSAGATPNLSKMVKGKKYAAYKGSGVDLKKDAERPAKPIGKRKSKSGNTYYEYRLNRLDVKQPPKRYPKLEDGGMMADGGENSTVFYVNDFYPNYDIDKIKEVLKSIDAKKIRTSKKYGWSNQPDVVVFVGDKNKAQEALEKEFNNYISVRKKDWGKFEDGGMMAKGGFTDSFEEANKKWNDMSVEDRESLLMKYFSKFEGGSKSEFEKIAKEYSHKNFDSQSEFVQVMLTQSLYKEDGGMMAKGGQAEKPMSYYKYETPKVSIYWKGKLQPLGRFKSAEEAYEVVKKQSSRYNDMKDYEIHTPDKVFNFADGGYMADGGEVKDYSGEYFSIREFVEEHEGMDKIVAEKYKIDVKDVDDNLDGELGYDTEVMRNLLKGKGYKISYDNKNDLIIVKKKMEDGGMMAKGGFTDSFEEANKKWNDMSVEDRESLLMKYFSKFEGGSKSEFEKIAKEYSHKNFDSQSEFVQVMLTQSLYKEDGGMMAHGGEMHRLDKATMAHGGKTYSEKEFKELLEKSLNPLYVGLNNIEQAMRYLEVTGQDGVRGSFAHKVGLSNLKESIDKIDAYTSK